MSGSGLDTVQEKYDFRALRFFILGILDKIEEAQKELHNPEDLPKGVLETGRKTALDIVKGIKRKKIVTDNHLKKISKSPSRNRTQEKLGSKTEDSTTLNFSSDDLKSPANQNHSLAHNGKQYSKHNGGVCSIATVDSLKSGTSMQTKKDFLSHQFPELGHGEQEGHFSGDKVTLPEDTSVSTISSDKTKTETLSSLNYSTRTTCTSTALDVLLKAMEPELNTLTQKINNCGAHTEKVRSNKTYSSFSSSLKSVQNTDSTSQLETCPRIHPYSCAAHIVQLSASGKHAEVPVQSPSHSLCQQEQSVSQIDHRLQRLSSCPNSPRSVETVKLKQMYSLPVSSSIGHSVPQAVPQHQLIANSSKPISISSASSTQFTLASTYNLAQVTSLVNQGGEQMCALILKDHKAKKQGKYICEYCKRACAKPSVLLKHIRSHTGERPYPCVTCGFSFKTKSNLYKHKKSHAHAIKLGLKPDSTSFSQESDKSLCIHSDLDESGESDDEYTSEDRQDDQHFVHLESTHAVQMTADPELHTTSHIQISPHDNIAEERLSLEKNSEASISAALPQVVVFPVTVSSSKMNCAKPIESNPESVGAPRQVEFIPASVKPSFTYMPSLKEAVLKKGELLQSLEKHVCNAITSHAQLQRQQATECSQDQQGKCLLSPRSLGSTDSGYFSRSESADQTISSPSPFVRVLPICEKDPIRNLVSVSRTTPSVASVVHMVCSDKPLNIFGTMRPPAGPKTLEERISKLISDNEAVVDDKQLDSVKPRRTSLSRRGSIDSPKSYIFKDSFQFDLKPVGRRTSSGSEFPKSPFTPNEKSKQVFFLSVPSQFPSLDCLPITRSNSMPTTGCSVVPAPVIPPPHPLRGSQSFDDKIGSLCDDVFVSAPTTPSYHVGHPRTLVRQTAVEDSINDNQGLGPARSVDEGYGCNASTEAGLPRSKSFVQGSSLDRLKKPHQGRGTMFECETCRNRYRKLENFENHKKFYCSELHGPKSKPAVRETEQNVAQNSILPQMLHYRVAASTGILEQPPQIRKRRKVKSVGDDDEPPQNESGVPVEEKECLQSQSMAGHCTGSAKNNVVIAGQYSSIPLTSPQVQLISRGTEESIEQRLSPIPETVQSVSHERVELKRQGSGISVIQHTNSLSRPSSFEKTESFERTSPVSFQETNRTSFLSNVEVILVDENSNQSLATPDQLGSSNMDSQEEQESQSIDTSERSTLVSQSRLVRQHNIQVPEILVTEEPDRDPESAINDQETEKFNWPQRSESLSNLPTEKLPPKKKRIRLAELEHSSGESSFDSTLSRSLSRESSLSRASSFSASFDKEDISKAESTSKLEVMNKSSEYLMLPTGVHVLGVPREMRRAASEQITCTQSSMEIPDYRSKSFDCGSMSPLRSVSPLETLTPKVSCTGATGHVPLLERRRGPFVRQISLNISPEHTLPQVASTCLFQKAAVSSAASFHKSQTHCQAQAVLPDSSSYVPVCIKSLIELHTLVKHCSSSNLPSVVAQLHSVNRDKHTQSPIHHSTLKSNDKTKEEEKQNVKPLSRQVNGTESCFAPKYQIQVSRPHEKSICHSEQTLDGSCNKGYSDSHNLGHNSISIKQSSKLFNSMPSNYSVPQQKVSGSSDRTMPQRAPFVVPVHDYSNLSPYCCSTSVKLPEILVTQDQVNPPTACTENLASMPSPDSNVFMPKTLEDSPSNLPNTNSPSSSEDNISEIGGQHLAGSLNFFVKVPVCGLLPQQDGTASSKRMLSPANSLDIAMEKNQKRVKDDSGAAFTTEARSAHLLTMRGGEQNRPKKHVLVRQECTTEPLDTLDQEVVPQYEINKELSGSLNAPLLSNHPSDVSTPRVSESLKVSSGFAIAKCSQASCSPARKSPELSSVKNETQLLNSPSTNQERRLRVVTCQGKPIAVQGQVKLATSLSMINAGDMHRLSFPSLMTSTSFTWCYLLKRKPLHLQQNYLKISAYSAWTVDPKNPNPLGLPTKVALSLLNSKQKEEQCLYTNPVTSRSRCDVLVYSSKWKNRINKQKLANHKTSASEGCDTENLEPHSENEKDGYLIKHEPRRVKIFDGGYKSNEEYVYVRGRGRGKYICEECGIRCKKPSMLKKHIRTHTDVRPYHCNHCNFSFKTKGNLTKHMKSKAHSKKCIEMGVPDDQYDDQDGDESGDKNRFGCERPGFDGEDSDGPEEDDNENDDEDEDSQAESTLSTTPSVTTSPQHYPYRNSQHETSSADEELRVPDCLSRADSMDVLPKALLTKMTARSTGPENKANRIPMADQQQEACESRAYEAAHNTDSVRTLEDARKSLCHQMSIDSTDAEGPETSTAVSQGTAVTKDALSVKLPSSPVDRGTQTTMMAPFIAFTEYDLGPQETQTAQKHNTEFAAAEAHLFSHLPLHSQQPARAPYSMVPIGGIQLVPAGLAAYSAFLPIQAGSMQLTFPAVGVFHRSAGAPGDQSSETAGSTNSVGITEVNSVLPCIPIGQVHVPGLPKLTTPLPSLSVETLNILGIANSNLAPPVHPSGLTLNALGLQVLTPSPSVQNNPCSQTHIPGLQIVNIALPTLIPSVSPRTSDGQGLPEPSASSRTISDDHQEQKCPRFPVADSRQFLRAGSPSLLPTVQESSDKKLPELAAELNKLNTEEKCATEKTDKVRPTQPLRDFTSVLCKTSSASESVQRGHCESLSLTPSFQTLPTDTQTHRRVGLARRQNTVQYCDNSSDDDEDRLVIAT